MFGSPDRMVALHYATKTTSSTVTAKSPIAYSTGSKNAGSAIKKRTDKKKKKDIKDRWLEKDPWAKRGGFGDAFAEPASAKKASAIPSAE